MLDVSGLPPPRLAFSRLALLYPATCSQPCISARCVQEQQPPNPQLLLPCCKQKVCPSTREPTPYLYHMLRQGAPAALSLPCEDQQA